MRKIHRHGRGDGRLFLVLVNRRVAERIALTREKKETHGGGGTSAEAFNFPYEIRTVVSITRGRGVESLK